MSSGVETVTWATLKTLLAVAPIDFSYVPTATYYYIYTSGIVTLVCAIPMDGGTDVLDFETNYKSDAVDFFYQEINQYRNVTGNGTTVVKTGPGLLRALTINNNTTGGDVIIYDNTVASGTIIMSLQLGSPSGGLLSTSGLPGPVSIPALDVRFNIGLTIVRTGSTNNNVTVYYR